MYKGLDLLRLDSFNSLFGGIGIGLWYIGIGVKREVFFIYLVVMLVVGILCFLVYLK